MRHQTTLLLLLIALSGCRAGGDGNSADAAASELVGLYESRDGPRRNQMCLIDRDGTTRFGLVVWAGEGDTSCTGKGRATRDGERLSLAMQGDESCRIEARIEGGRVTLPTTLPQGCAYYCGPGAQMTGARFERSGGSTEDAARAVDLVGDPLCG